MAGSSILTVTTPAASTALTTLAAVKAELGITASTDDVRFGNLIARASSAIVTACGRPFGLESLTETFRYSWRAGNSPLSQSGPRAQSGEVEGPAIPLERLPVVSIVSVTESGVVLDPATDYEVNKGAGLLYRLRGDSRSWWSFPTVTVAYTAGYVLPGDGGTRTLPADVEALCIALVAGVYQATSRSGDLKSETVEGVGRMDYFDRGRAVFGMDDEGVAASLTQYVSRGW